MESARSGDRIDLQDSESWLERAQERWHESYSSGSHCKIEEGGKGIISYEPSKLSSMRIFTSLQGTVFQDPIIFIEQFLLTMIFFASAFPIWWYFNRKFEFTEGYTLSRSLDSQEDKIRAFTGIMTTLAAFLLTFYTSIIVSRWWTVRTAGVGNIKAAVMELELYISQLVPTAGEQVLSAIRRYARASLLLIFMWRRHHLPKEPEAAKAKLAETGLLTQDEAEQLVQWNHNLHESIWTWQVRIIKRLHEDGHFQSEDLLVLLMERCSQGRAGVQTVATHLAVQVPMQYVHLLGLLIKLHNLIMAVLMGILFGGAVRDRKVIVCLQLFCRMLLLPWIFNAMLIINAELSDPFDGGVSDFPAKTLDRAIEADGKAFPTAGAHLPPWLAKRHAAAEARKF